MPLFRTILIAADFSEPSRQAFHLACALADERKTRLFVVQVIEGSHVAEQAVGFGEQGELILVEDETPAHHRAVRDQLRESYAPTRALDVTYDVRDGNPGEEILRVAEQIGCDLVVMGTHGRTGLRRLLAGSVAESVLRRARCPVLALRTAEQAGTTEPIGVILHPVELEAYSEPALSTARALARELGARLVLTYVAPLDLMLNDRATVVTDIDEYRRALEEIRARLDGPDLKYPVEARLERGNVAGEILGAAKDTGCNLIVMGTHGRTGLGRLLMGSAVEQVLHEARCPVLVVKEPTPVPAEA